MKNDKIAAHKGPDASIKDAPKRAYNKPELRSTEAFERLPLLSCGGASEEEGDCDEL